MPSGLGFRHYAAYVMLCAIWGSTWMAIRVVVSEVPPLWAAAVRFAIAGFIVAAVVLAQRVPLPRNREEWKHLLILSLTMMAIPFGLVFWAEQHVTSAMTAVLWTSSPLLISSLTPFMTGKKVPRPAIVAMVVAAGGIGVLFHSQLTATTKSLVGGVAILLAVTSSGWSALYSKKHILGVPPMVTTGVQLAVGTVVLGAASLLFEDGQGLRWSAQATAAMIFLAVFGSAVAFATYYWLLRKMHPYQLSTISLIVPLVAIAEGALLLQEPIPPMMLIASIVVLLGVGMVLRAQSDEPIELKLKPEAASD